MLRVTDSPFLDICKERRKGIKVCDTEWIVLMVMAFSTSHCGSHKNGGCVPNSVRSILGCIFFGLCSTFAGGLNQPIETRRNLISDGLPFITFQEITSQLLHDEPVVRFVLIESIDDVITIHPAVTKPILVIAHGVGVSNQVQPHNRQAFSKVWRIQKLIDLSLVGFCG